MKNFNLLALVAASIAFACTVVEVESLKPSITLHRESDPDDSTFSVHTQYEEPSLFSIKNLLGIHSTCKTGKWIICNGANYADRCAVLSFSASHTCRNLATGWYGNVSSVRYVGSGEDVDATALNLYNLPEYTGNSTLVLEDVPNSDWAFQSVILSGVTPVTFFTRSNYEGLSVCVENQHHDGNYTLIQDITLSFGISSSEINSIKFGCHSKNVLTNLSPPKHILVEA